MAGAAFLGERQPPVQAKSNYLTAFVAAYPHTAASALNSCSVCHTSIPQLNSYGHDYQSHGRNFDAIELLDSDGDGYTNLEEIQALTFPGDANSYPSTPPTPTPSPSPTSTPTSTPAPLVGDLNGDCHVDVVDIMMVASHWGEREGDPNWDPALDLVADGQITVIDIMAVAVHWGDACGAVQSQAHSRLVAPAQTAIMAVEPASATWPLSDGLYTIVVRAEQVQSLAGYEVTLAYDPTLLDLIDVEFSDWLSETGRTVSPLGPNIDENAGTTRFGAFSFGNAPGVSGDGPLATLRFRPLAAGKAQFSLQNAVMNNETGGSIPVQTQSGMVQISASGSVTYMPMMWTRE